MPLLLTHAELEPVASGEGLEFAVIKTAIERFLADLRTLEDHSESVAEIRVLCRDLYLAAKTHFWREIEGRVDAVLSNPQSVSERSGFSNPSA